MQTWHDALAAEKAQPYFQNILASVRAERASGQTIYPPAADVFNAFKLTEFAQTKIVILGQDPYHNERQAHGLAFSVQQGISPPPSLVNIYKELADDIAGFQIPVSGCLNHWAEQGVLLLNTVLTVRAHAAASHQGHGWERFTDHIISLLGARERPLAFILWGSPARRKRSLITNPAHLIVESPHPSPLSAHRGFFGSRPFSRVNDFLVHAGETPITWQLPPASEIEA